MTNVGLMVRGQGCRFTATSVQNQSRAGCSATPGRICLSGLLCSSTTTGRKTGKQITLPKVDVWYIENGKATEFMEYFDTHAAVQAATP